MRLSRFNAVGNNIHDDSWDCEDRSNIPTPPCLASGPMAVDHKGLCMDHLTSGNLTGHTVTTLD
jgi:hypothetical protein